MSKKICFATLKGGVGKTTLSYMIGCSLARTAKVLMVDLDPQCNLSANFNKDIFSKDAFFTIGDIFPDPHLNLPEVEPGDLILKSGIEKLPDLDLIASNMYLYGSELALAQQSMREQKISLYLKEHQDFFDYYDYIIFDCSPSMGLINQNAFFACDHIILVTDPDCNSARGGDVFMELWDGIRMKGTPSKIDALIMNSLERTKVTKELINYIQEHKVFSKIVLQNTVPHLTAFKESILLNLPVCLNPKRTASVKAADAAIENVIDELIERGIL